MRLRPNGRPADIAHRYSTAAAGVRVESKAMPSLPRNVKALGAVSLLNDASSEMIYPLLPAFVTGTLGAPPTALGAIEGAAEAAAAVVKVVAGRWSDRAKR